jgi:exodeoxyribonuclease VII large subunit
MALESARPDPALARETLTVSALNRAVAGFLQRGFPLVRVRGEIAGLTRAASGHWYFGLKDDAAQVRCVMFRNRNTLAGFAPCDGDAVEVLAQVSFYEPRGEFQLTVESMRRAGAGALYEEFLRLKAKLAAEGLFDEAGKRALPRAPLSIGIVTSLQAAALGDVVTAFGRRAPYARLVVYPVPVQGQDAAQRIAWMLGKASRRAEVEVLLLVRGGGSIEDLWAFNDEALARAIRACRMPVITGIGHESDFTIADFAADLRAPTPTAAAELAAPDRATLLDGVAANLAQLRRAALRSWRNTQQRVDFAARTLASPRTLMRGLHDRVVSAQRRLALLVVGHERQARVRHDRLLQRLARAQPATHARALELERLQRRLQQAAGGSAAAARSRVDALRQALALLDPARVLARGYSIVRDERGALVRSAADVRAGATVDIDFASGGASARIEKLRSP